MKVRVKYVDTHFHTRSVNSLALLKRVVHDFAKFRCKRYEVKFVPEESKKAPGGGGGAEV